MGLLPVICTDFRNHETITAPGTDTETSYGCFLIPNQPSEIGYYEMSTSLIIDLDDIKDVDDNDETLRQPTDLSTYRSQSRNNKDIEMYNGILHSKISS